MRRPALGQFSRVAIDFSCSAARFVSSNLTFSGIMSKSSSCAFSSSGVGAEDIDAVDFGTWVGAGEAARAIEEDTNDRVLCRAGPVLDLAIDIKAIPGCIYMSAACLMHVDALVSIKSVNLGVLIVVCCSEVVVSDDDQ